MPGLPGSEELSQPEQWLSPFRIANSYGLFAVMTEARYEIEFQGSPDGKTWTPYRFLYKPQDVLEAPKVFAPYQPRFDWNLWFASLGTWQNYPWVINVQKRLRENSPQVLSLFRDNPFASAPPKAVRAVVYQYWFSEPKTRSGTGQWWTRKLLGLYAPPTDHR